MKEQILTEIDDIFQEFKDSDKQQCKLPFVPMDYFDEYFTKMNCTEFLDELDTNGWDHDFWIYFTIKDQRYSLQGSWYYGNYTLEKR